MTTLSELFPVGGGGNTSDFVASGTLPNGKPVILKSDGKVEAVGLVPTPVSQDIPEGDLTVFNAGNCNEIISMSFDPSTAGKFVVAWKEGGVGQLCIGTRVGSVLTFGTEVVFASSVTRYLQVAYDPNNANKFAINYGIGGNGYGTCRIGVVSGSSVSLGSAVTWASGEVQQVSFAFDPSTNNKFVVCAKNEGNSNKGEAYVGTISGSSVSFGSAVIFNDGSTNSIDMSFDANTANKFIVVCRADNDSNKGKASVGVVNGTSISFGTAVEFSSTAAYVRCDYDPNTANKFILTYREDSAVASLIKVGTVNGTSVSFNSAVTWESIDATSGSQYDISWDKNTATKFIINYKVANSQGKVALGTFNGTSVSFATSAVFLDAGITISSSGFDTENGVFVVAFSKRTAGGGTTGTFHGAALVSQIAATKSLTNLTATNFLGTSTKAFTNGQTATILLKGGVSSNQSNLTAGSTYFVQPNGTISTVSTSPAVLVGEAVSATSLLLNALARPSTAGLVLLSTVNASDASTVTLDSLFTSTYSKYLIEVTDLRVLSNNNTIQLRRKIGSGSFGNYEWIRAERINNTWSNRTPNITESLNSATSQRGAVFTLSVYDPANALTVNLATMFGGAYSGFASGGSYIIQNFLTDSTVGALTELEFKASSGNISGIFKIYGVSI